MGKIKLKNIKVYAYHGCLQEEAKIGSEYRIDVTVKADLSKSAVSDHLHDTIDYVALNRLVKEEMAKRSALLEHVAKRILDRTLQEHPAVTEAKIVVAKINPPIGGNVENVSVIMTAKQNLKKNT